VERASRRPVFFKPALCSAQHWSAVLVATSDPAQKRAAYERMIAALRDLNNSEGSH
jgi:hypothetical protein